MENHKLVLPEHLNHYGYLFGGNLLKWADEYSWIAASLDYPQCNFVTIGLDRVEFKKSVKEGAILKFKSEKTKEGNTSVQYFVSVLQENNRDNKEDIIFSTYITYVCMDEKGKKMPLAK